MKHFIVALIGIFLGIGVGYAIEKRQNILQAFAGGGSNGSSLVATATPFPTPTSIQEIELITPIPTQGSIPSTLSTAGGGPRNDIIESVHVTASKPVAQVGDDINFSVTIKNHASYKKLIKQLCFDSSDGNFGCTRDFNLFPGDSFQYNNSGRFTSGGVKTIWVTWTQDGQNFYRPVNGGTVSVTIQN